jgi:hypothetical protein
MRNRPKIELLPCPPSYARLCAQGWDSIQEAHALIPSPSFAEFLKAAQEEARAIDESRGLVLREIGGEQYKVHALGAKRFRYRFGNDDFFILIANGNGDWNISIRYSPAGLCEHGWDALQKRALRVLRPLTIQTLRDSVRVSRADWFFDFYTPDFVEEMQFGIAANAVCHSSVKKFETTQTIGVGQCAQTLTLGSRASLQNTLYDKTREIVEASGKDWLYGVWAAGLDGEWPWRGIPRDVIRLEVRMFCEFLKQRNCRRPPEVQQNREALLTEALYTRRLVVPQENDTNRRRWPIHPLFSEAIRHSGTPDMLPLGRKVTGVRNVLFDRLQKQIAGTIRSALVLENGEYTSERADKIAKETLTRITEDPKHYQKLLAARDRYFGVDEAR